VSDYWFTPNEHFISGISLDKIIVINDPEII